MVIINIIFSSLFLLWFFVVAYLIWRIGNKSLEHTARMDQVLTESVLRTIEIALKTADAAKVAADAAKALADEKKAAP